MKNFIFDVRGDGYKIDIGNVTFRENCMIRVRQAGMLNLGNNIGFNRGCSINCLNSITIGDDCLFGESVKLYDHNHRFRDNTELIERQGYTLGKISIGNNCWIGSNVVILKNVTIGDNVVIGANCLVYKDVPSNTLVKSTGDIEFQPIGYSK